VDDEQPAHKVIEAQLDAERERRDMNWREVADALPMSPQNLSRIRNGEISVSREARKKIDKFLAGAPAIARQPSTSLDPADDWTAEEVERARGMSVDEIVAEGRMIGKFSGEEAQLRYLRKAADVKLQKPVTPPA
jgi:transcriptional regulator with XRE-family HTH domain